MGVLGRNNICIDVGIGLGEELAQGTEFGVLVGVSGAFLSKLRWGLGGYGAGATDNYGGKEMLWTLGKLGAVEIELAEDWKGGCKKLKSAAARGKCSQGGGGAQRKWWRRHRMTSRRQTLWIEILWGWREKTWWRFFETLKKLLSNTLTPWTMSVSHTDPYILF